MHTHLPPALRFAQGLLWGFLSIGTLVSTFSTGRCFSAEKPEITRFTPASTKVGGTELISCVGSFKSWPVSIWSSSQDVQWKCNEKAGEFEVTVQANAKPAITWVRFYNEAGATPPKPFLISNKKPFRESEPNDRITQVKESVAPDTEVFGVLEKNGDIDHYRLDLKQGETISAIVDATRYLKSPLDAHLQLLDSRGFVLLENLDHYGLDPAIEYKISKDGPYYLRVFGFPEQPDSTISFRGGAEYVYRLRWNVGPLELDTLPVVDEHWTAPSIPTVQATSIQEATAVTTSDPQFGIFPSAAQTHSFKLPTANGKLLHLRVLSQSIGSDLDPTLTIVDKDGKQQSFQDDAGTNRDPDIRWVVPKEGEYWANINDFHKRGNHASPYWFKVDALEPGIAPSITNDLLDAKASKEFDVGIKIERLANWTGELELITTGLPEGSTLKPNKFTVTKDAPKSLEVKLVVPKAFDGVLPIEIKLGDRDAPIKIAGPSPAGTWLHVSP